MIFLVKRHCVELIAVACIAVLIILLHCGTVRNTVRCTVGNTGIGIICDKRRFSRRCYGSVHIVHKLFFSLYRGILFTICFFYKRIQSSLNRIDLLRRINRQGRKIFRYRLAVLLLICSYALCLLRRAVVIGYGQVWQLIAGHMYIALRSNLR